MTAAYPTQDAVSPAPFYKEATAGCRVLTPRRGLTHGLPGHLQQGIFRANELRRCKQAESPSAGAQLSNAATVTQLLATVKFEAARISPRAKVLVAPGRAPQLGRAAPRSQPGRPRIVGWVTRTSPRGDGTAAITASALLQHMEFVPLRRLPERDDVQQLRRVQQTLHALPRRPVVRRWSGPLASPWYCSGRTAVGLRIALALNQCPRPRPRAGRGRSSRWRCPPVVSAELWKTMLTRQSGFMNYSWPTCTSRSASTAWLDGTWTASGRDPVAEPGATRQFMAIVLLGLQVIPGHYEASRSTERAAGRPPEADAAAAHARR